MGLCIDQKDSDVSLGCGCGLVHAQLPPNVPPPDPSAAPNLVPKPSPPPRSSRIPTRDHSRTSSEDAENAAKYLRSCRHESFYVEKLIVHGLQHRWRHHTDPPTYEQQSKCACDFRTLLDVQVHLRHPKVNNDAQDIRCWFPSFIEITMSF